MPIPEELREKADHYRRMAARHANRGYVNAFIALADEYQKLAREAERDDTLLRFDDGS